MHKHTVMVIGILLLLISCAPATGDDILTVPEDAIARIVYFYAEDCSLCQTLYDEILVPLANRCGKSLEIKAIQVDTTEGYEVFDETEDNLIGDSGRWDIPTIVVGETFFIGEEAIRTGLVPHLQCVFGDGGNAWPDIPSLLAFDDQSNLIQNDNPFTGLDEGVEECISEEEIAVCASPNPIFVLYFSTEACESTCDRTLYDLRYLQGVFPQMFFEEKDIITNTKLAKAIIDAFGITMPDDLVAPAIVVGTDYLTGDMLILDNLTKVINKYSESGALAVWYTLGSE